MKTAIATSHFLATPGQPTRVEIEVTNTAEVIDGVTAIVDGINPDWVRLERPVLSLFPDVSDRLAIVFDIPKHCPAGDYLIVVRILSTIADERATIHDFWLTVGTLNGVDLSLRPSIVTGGKQASIDATITNTGNAAAGIEVSALEPTRAVDCRVDPSRFMLGPGAPAVLPILLRGPRPWFGQPAARQIHITAGVGDQAVERIATFHQKPRIPRGLVTALMLAGIILLWALIFLWVIGELRASESVAKAPGTSFMDGPDNIPLGVIGGTAEGRVTAATTGEGIPRITVEALRLTPPEPQAIAGSAADDACTQPIPSPTRANDECLTLIASAVTDDDGSFSIPSLIPGTYQLRASADGYLDVWYAAEGRRSVQDGNPDVEVEPAATTRALDVVMAGMPGSIEGKIALPPGADQVALTVMATIVDTDDPSSDDTQPAVDEAPTDCPATACQTTTDGTVALDGLPTPATYVVSVTGEGFETQLFEQAVGGGQQAVINTVNLVPEDGVLEGLVLDQNSAPLGGVEVVARTGAIEVRAITPTTGPEVGTFRFAGLAAPATYVVTFQRADFGSQTKSLRVEPGTPTTMEATTLISGSGTITGAAVSSSGAPLGGITVEVSGDTFKGQTSTLTTSGENSPAGSFTISGLPVPGEYTVTFRGENVQSETVAAALDPAQPQRSVGTVVLLPRTSEVSGTVRVNGGGIGEVEVVLTDGDRSQITTSATNPAGQYAFANVPEGSYTLTFSRQGLVRQITLVRVVAGEETVRDVSMVPAP
jgi:hypothetical protein